MFEELVLPPPRALPVDCYRQLRRALFPLFAAGATLVMAVLGAHIAFSVQHHTATTLARRGVAVNGTLVDKISGRFVVRLTVAYPAGRDRRLHAVRQWVRASPENRWLLLGDPVRVFYDPADPDRAAVESLATPQGSLARSLPVVVATAAATLMGLLLLVTATNWLRTMRRLLVQGTLVPARLLRPARWKTLWFAQLEFSHEERVRQARSFVPPGWRPAAYPGARSLSNLAVLLGPGKSPRALLLIQPSPEEW